MASAPGDLASLQIFTLQLSVMLNAGVSLPRGLEVLTQMGGSMAEVADRLLLSVEHGKALSVGMEEQRAVFPVTYRRVIRVGESTGQLNSVLPALSRSLSGQLETRRRFLASLTYPAFVLLVSGCMVSFLLFYQMPKLLSAFGSGPQLPTLTRVVLGSMKPLAILGVLLLGSLVGCGLAMSRSERFRDWMLRRANRIPRLGKLLFDYSLIHVCADLSMMLTQGIELTRALRTVLEGGTGCPPLDDELNGILNDILHGDELSACLQKRDFPKLLTLMVRSGEELGQIHGAFRQYQEMGESRLQYASEAFLQMLEPCLHLFMGLVVGTLVLACFLPVYQTLQQI
jgi:type IV pilus assembly protein PilC